MSSEPDSLSLHPFEVPTLSCEFCFTCPADFPTLPDHPIHSVLDQAFPDPLRMKGD